MARLIIENISIEQAKELGHWYEGEGEQMAYDWLMEGGVKAPLTDVGRDGGFMKVEGDTVTIYCK